MGARVTTAFVGPHATAVQVGDAVDSIAPEYAPLRDVILSKGINGAALLEHVKELAGLIAQDRRQTLVMIGNYHRLMGWCHWTPAFLVLVVNVAARPNAPG